MKQRIYHFVNVQAAAKQLVREMGNNKTHAARLIGVSWLTLHRWMRGQPARPIYAEEIIRVLRKLKKQPKAA